MLLLSMSVIWYFSMIMPLWLFSKGLITAQSSHLNSANLVIPIQVTTLDINLGAIRMFDRVLTLDIISRMLKSQLGKTEKNSSMIIAR